VAYYQAFLVFYTSLFNFLFMRSSNYGRVSVTGQRYETHLTEGIVVLSSEKDPDVPLSSSRILLCSAIAKMTASVTTYPHEVVRTRLQTQRRPLADDASSDGMVKAHVRRGVIYTTKKIIVKEGWTGLYKGLSINLIRTVPNSAVTMLTCVFSICIQLPN
jgi:Mitochondrial carrier protein